MGQMMAQHWWIVAEPGGKSLTLKSYSHRSPGTMMKHRPKPRLIFRWQQAWGDKTDAMIRRLIGKLWRLLLTKVIMMTTFPYQSVWLVRKGCHHDNFCQGRVVTEITLSGIAACERSSQRQLCQNWLHQKPLVLASNPHKVITVTSFPFQTWQIYIGIEQSCHHGNFSISTHIRLQCPSITGRAFPQYINH